MSGGLCQGESAPAGLGFTGGTRCPGGPVLVLRVEQLEHRQRYRVSMNSNYSETENTSQSKMFTKDNITYKYVLHVTKSVVDCLQHFS